MCGRENMEKILRNYKVSCVGVDDSNQPARLSFFIYGVRAVENAFRIVRKDSYRRKMMRRENINWETVQLDAVECDKLGEVFEEELGNELIIMERQLQTIKQLCNHTQFKFWLGI